MLHRNLVLFSLISGSLVWGQNPAVTVTVDANANRHAINPNIYGTAYGDATTLPALNAPLNRMGGNNTSRYNWQQNADNRGQDWYFESIGDNSAVAGERADTFFSMSRSAGAQTMMTIPMVGYVAKLGSNRSKLASFSQAKYGQQTDSDWQWFPDAGNGVLKSTNQNVTGNDPNDANVAADSAFQQSWVQHIVSTWGPASSGGLRYYILDNEHSIWHSTHRDVHPTGATMDEIKTKMLDYAAKVKAVDPSALVVGPEEWGWSGYFYSGYDQQYGSLHGWSTLPDRNNHGGQDYLPWLLSQLKTATVANGLPPLDVFSVHYYPQGGEFGNDTSSTMQLRRNRSTRSLWDPNYVDETWINDKVQLIPRLRNWVNTYYRAGTPIAITEYNWGAEGHINGATTQADILGIFGREGLDMATRWTTPDASTPTFKAIQLYRNYDGSKSGFGDTSVQTVAPNPDNLSAFGAVRSSDGALTVIVINKYLSGSTPLTLSLANFTAGSAAKTYQLTSANTITNLADTPVSNGTITATLPQQSITLFVIPAGTGTTNKPPVAVVSANPTSGAAPLAVAFNGSGSSDPDGTIASYAWTFGDGATGSGAQISHTYTAAGTYTAKLTVTDNGGASSSATVSIAVSAGTVATPTNLTATAGNATATLTWTAVSGATGYNVKRGTASAGPFTTVAANVSTASYINSGLTNGTTYYYVVSALNGSVESANSAVVSVTPFGATKFEAESLAVAAISSGVTTQILSESGLSGGKAVVLNATAVGQSITFTVNAPQAGTYDVKVGYKKSKGRGIFQTAVDGVNLGATVDEYSSSNNYTYTDLGNVAISSAGAHSFRFTVTGKRSNSSSYSVDFDYITLTPQ